MPIAAVRSYTDPVEQVDRLIDVLAPCPSSSRRLRAKYNGCCLYSEFRPTMPPKDSIPLPPRIHAIIRRWHEFFNLMDDTARGADASMLDILGPVAFSSQATVTVEQVKALFLFSYLLLSGRSIVSSDMKQEALELCRWLRPWAI
jgi:hypothetical protein